MFKNYLKIALRNLLRYKTYSVINIAGLAMGMAAAILITLWVRDELSYDRFHAAGERIFRVKYTLDLNGIQYREASIPFPAAEAFRNEFPEVEKAVRIYRNVDFPLISYGERKFAEERFLFADPSFFEVFDFPLLQGDPRSALAEPNSVVISEAAARKYFGDTDPLGQILKYETQHSLKITGVAANPPGNSHFRFDFLASLDFQIGLWESVSGAEGREKKWFWSGAWTYLLLKEPGAAAGLNAKLPGFEEKYFPDRIKAGVALSLQPLSDIHLHSNLDNEIEPTGSALYVYIFSAIALFILLIAGINFINLSTAQSANRAKEIGMRKVLGAFKTQLARQLLGETLATSFLALICAIGLVELFLPAFNHLTGKRLEIDLLENWQGIVFLAGLALTVGIFSGLYPAFVLSGLQPVRILKKDLLPGSGREWLRKSLVVAQFAISIALMIGIGVIHRQLQYIQNKNLGFEREKVLFVKARPGVSQKFETFRQELTQNPAILNVTGTTNVPGEGVYAYRFVPEGTSEDTPAMLPLLLVDYDFPETMGIELKQGRWLSREFPSDPARAFLLNETAAEQLGWKENAIGKKMALFGPGTSEIVKTGEVIGVIGDYHFESLHHEVKPLVLTFATYYDYYAVKLAPGDVSEPLLAIEAAWQKFSPEWPLEYFFLNRFLEQRYAGERNLSLAVNCFTAIAIFVACLGLFGLSIFTAEKRTREIGVRKVLGATVANIVRLLSFDFLKPVLIAAVIACPAAYLLMNAWLRSFAYRIEIDWWVFVLAGGLALLIALLTVSFQAIRAALASPVKSLRYE